MLLASGTIYVRRPRNHTSDGLKWRVNESDKVEISNGEIPRGDAERLTGLKERSARTVLSSLTADGILGSSSPKGPVSLRFSVESARILFPKLFDDIPLESEQMKNQKEGIGVRRR